MIGQEQDLVVKRFQNLLLFSSFSPLAERALGETALLSFILTEYGLQYSGGKMSKLQAETVLWG